jgi:hypothetical protein
MMKHIRRLAVLVLGCTYIGSGCVTNAQLGDFGRTEVSRVISDVIGQLLFNALRAGSTNPSSFL